MRIARQERTTARRRSGRQWASTRGSGVRTGVSLSRIWALRRALATGQYNVSARLEVVAATLLRELRRWRHAHQKHA